MEEALTIMPSYATVAFQTSITTCQFGVPFGGTTSWVLIVIMSNDSGAYPWAPLQAAIIGFPITILCDLILLIPALIICFLTYPRRTV